MTREDEITMPAAKVVVVPRLVKSFGELAGEDEFVARAASWLQILRVVSGAKYATAEHAVGEVDEQLVASGASEAGRVKAH